MIESSRSEISGSSTSLKDNSAKSELTSNESISPPKLKY